METDHDVYEGTCGKCGRKLSVLTGSVSREAWENLSEAAAREGSVLVRGRVITEKLPDVLTLAMKCPAPCGFSQQTVLGGELEVDDSPGPPRRPDAPWPPRLDQLGQD